ncbi:MAG: hypothetical protein ACI977_000061 [Candidatus Nanohaloarchaea archaeon]|jgi:hypothetical protein
MRTKLKSALIAGLTYFLVSFTAASHGQETSLSSFEGIISFVGLKSGSLMHNIGIAATFGLLWVSVYMILKKLVVKFDLQQLFNLESGGIGQAENKRNLLAVLSLLLIISMMGAGHWIEPLGLIWDIQQILVVALVFGVIALLISVLGGGAAGVAWTTGKTGKALNQGLQEIKDARQELNNIGGGGNGNGGNASKNAVDLEEAVDDIESAYSHIEPAIHQSEQDINSDINAIIDAVNNPGRGSSASYRQVGARINNFRNALELLYNKANTGSGYTEGDVINGQNLFQNSNSDLGSKDLPDKYKNFGLKAALHDITEIRSAADRIQSKDEHDVAVLDDELNSLIADTKEIVRSVKALKKLLKEVEEAEDKEKVIKEAAREVEDRKLFDHHRTMNKHIEYLENHLQKDKSELQDIKDNLEEAKRRVKHELAIENPSDIQNMVDMLQNNSDSVDDLIDDICSEVASEVGGLTTSANLRDSIDSVKDDTVNILKGMLMTEEHKIEDDEEILKKLDEGIDAVDEVLGS